MSTQTCTQTTVTLSDGRAFTLKHRPTAPNLDRDASGNRSQAAQRGVWALGYVAACAAGYGTLGDRYLTCALTGETFDAWHAGDVDRLVPARGYVAGNVCLVSARGNDGRAYAQSLGADVPNVERYIARVSAATVPHLRPSGPAVAGLFNAYGSRAGRNRTQSTTRGDGYRAAAFATVALHLATA